ncbi:hypothetical protein NDU88_006302 [Pleurodeles waltl]|uniref:Uncharacterized protein n=1 Tax=Pleurodeles waltl TaxID=8319 RepID=A0AAV7MEK4_PLEWA|nr:hypothetical protein NDU88_006302 [Pleurodeles waltl]
MNAGAGGVLKPVLNEQKGEEFSPRGEEVDVLGCQTGGSEQTAGGRRRCEERQNNPGEEPEKGDQERTDRPRSGKSVAQAGTVPNHNGDRG